MRNCCLLFEFPFFLLVSRRDSSETRCITSENRASDTSATDPRYRFAHYPSGIGPFLSETSDAPSAHSFQAKSMPSVCRRSRSRAAAGWQIDRASLPIPSYPPAYRRAAHRLSLIAVPTIQMLVTTPSSTPPSRTKARSPFRSSQILQECLSCRHRISLHRVRRGQDAS